MGNPSTGGQAYATPKQEQAAPATSSAIAPQADFGSNQDNMLTCGGNPAGRQLDTYRMTLEPLLFSVIEAQTDTIHQFASVAEAAQGTTSDDVLAAMAVTALTIAMTGIAAMMGPAALAGGASTGMVLLLEQAYRAGVSQVTRAAVPAIVSRLRGVRPAERIEAFAEGMEQAVRGGQPQRIAALADATDGATSDQACALERGLWTAIATVPGIQYQACVEAWASATAAQREDQRGERPVEEGRDRPTELTASVQLDPRTGTGKLLGVRLPGLQGLLEPMGDHTVAGFRVSKVLSGPGFEVLIGADDQVVSIDATPEAREALRRCGMLPDAAMSAAWKASSGPLGDPSAEVHVMVGAMKLYNQLLAGKTLSALGVA
jgi:hypothetical protein